MPKNLDDIIRWGFGIFVVGASSMVIQSMERISRSIDTLNIQVAVVMEKVSTQGESSKQLERRVSDLEKNYGKKCRTH
jgi:hypothetical protein